MIGYKSFTISGLVWRSLPFGLALLSPPKKKAYSVSPSLLSNFLSLTRSILYVRWETDFDCSCQTSWWHVINDNPRSTDISAYSSKTRNQIRRGCKKFKCQLVERSFIINNGYEVYLRAFLSYDTDEECLDRDGFALAIDHIHVKTDFWGVFCNETGELVGFSENYLEDFVCFYNSIWIDPAAMKQYAAYSLFYSMNLHYLVGMNFSYVSDGSRCLSHSTKIHDFLISKFGFRKAYARLNVVYHPLLFFLVSSLYPFRKLISRLKIRYACKISILLSMENIRRLSISL